MADNTVLNAGAGGDTIATDDVGPGVKHQLVKVEFGGDGVATMVTATAGLPTDPLDRAARDLGKVDIASLDQYVPQDVDTGAGTVNALPVVLKKSAALGPDFGTATDPVRTDPTGTTTQPVSVAATVQVDVVDEALRDLGKVDVASLDQYTPVAGRLPVDGSGVTQPVSGTVSVTEPVSVDDNAGSLTIDAPVATPVAVRQSDGAAFIDPRLVQGNVAHDGVDAGNPIKQGARAIAHGTNPTAVAAADRTDLYANRAGIPFVLGGHPNIVTVEAAYIAVQTDTAIVTIGAGLKIVVTQIQMTADNANTVDVGFRVGFGTVNTPTTTGVVLTHPGVAAGSGISRGDGSGILGVGADGADLRITSEVPTTGSIRILVSYFTIES